MFGFLNAEFSKIKDEHLQQKVSKKFKLRKIEKKIKKLLKDIELILKTSSLANDMNTKIIDLKEEVENYFL